MFMLSKSCTVAVAMLALSVGTPGALGQAALPTQFTLRQLERQPGTILISPGYITIIEFPEAVSEALSGNQTLFKTSPRKGSNLVVLTAAKTTGQTDLLVRAGGKIAMFLVKIDAQGNAPRRYTVTGPGSAALPNPSRPVVATPTNSSAAATPSNRYEAEAAMLYRADPLKLGQASGGALVEHINKIGSRVTFPAVRVARSGIYTLRIHYANGYSGLAIQTLLVNGLAAPDVRYPPTGTWETISSVDVPVTLRAGINSLRLGRGLSGQGESVVTLDMIEVLPAGSIPAVQAQSTPVQAAPVSSGSGASRTRQAVVVPNNGFEVDLVGWSPWQDRAGVGVRTIGDKQAHGGDKYLVLSSTGAMKQNMVQTITGLSNGTYTMEIWVRTSGGRNGLGMFAVGYGGEPLSVNIPTTEKADWGKYTLPGIAVTDGQVQIGIWSSASTGNIWAHIDDVALYREADQP